MIRLVELTAPHKHALAFAKVNGLAVKTLQPGMRVPVGKVKEQPLHLNAVTFGKESLQAARAEIGKTLHQHIGLMEAFALRQLVKQFEDRALRRRESKGPVPFAPALNDPIFVSALIVLTCVFSFQVSEGFERQAAIKQLAVVVMEKAHAEIELVEPGGSDAQQVLERAAGLTEIELDGRMLRARARDGGAAL